MFVRRPGNCEGPSLQWGTLCPDVRRLILGKLPLRDLAHATPTCREFQEEFSSRIAVERARLVSAGEELYGKEKLCGFVRAFRRLMRGLDAYPGLLLGAENTLVINAAGEAELVSKEEEDQEGERTHAVYPRLSLWRASALRVLECELLTARFGIVRAPRIYIDVFVNDGGAFRWRICEYGKKGHEATVGLVLALRKEDPDDPPASWGSPLECVTLNLGRLSGDAGKRVGEDLVGPLRSRTESVTYEHNFNMLRVMFKPR